MSKKKDKDEEVLATPEREGSDSEAFGGIPFGDESARENPPARPIYFLEGEMGFKPSAPGVGGTVDGQISVYNKETGLVASIWPSKAEARAWADKENAKLANKPRTPRNP